MTVLGFKNAVFHAGRNVTVRRGIKWDAVEKKRGVPLWDGGRGVMLPVSPDIDTKVIAFENIPHADMMDEHDPVCRDYKGLLNTMKAIYPGFREEEIVTVIAFTLTEGEAALLNAQGG